MPFDPKTARAPWLFQIPMVILLLMPIGIAMAEFGFWDQVSWQSRYLLREYPWRLFPFVLVLCVVLAHQINRVPLPRLGWVNFGILAALYALNMVLRHFVSPEPELSSQFSTTYLLALTAGWASYYFATLYREKYYQSLYAALLFGAVLHVPAVFLLIHFQMDNPTFQWSLHLVGFGSIRIYGFILEAAIAVGIGILSFQQISNKARFFFVSACVVVMWMLLFWSGGRGGVLAVMLAVIFSCVIRPDFALKAIVIAVLTCFIGALLSMLIWMPDNSAFGVYRLANSVGRDTVESLSPGRLAMWQTTLEHIQLRPFFGYGLFQAHALLPVVTNESGVVVQAHYQVHNLVLEVLLAFGFLAGGVLLALMLKTWFRMIVLLRKTAFSTHWPAFLAFNTLLAHGLLAGTYAHVHSVIYLALLAGVCLQNGPKPRVT